MDVAGTPLQNRDDHFRERMLVNHDGPAFLRRARRAQVAFDVILAQCARVRGELLTMVRLRVGLADALLGDRSADDERIRFVRALRDKLAPELKGTVTPTTSERTLDLEFRRLGESIARFNRRWERHLNEVDLSRVNREREGYNRYYVLEKECATGSYSAARRGFKPLPPLTLAELWERFPLLPNPFAASEPA